MTAAPTWTDLGASLPERREGCVGFVVQGRIFVGLGWDGTTYYSDWYEFDWATQKFIRMANFPGTARINASAFVAGNAGFIVGGKSSGGVLTTECWAFDPGTNGWYARTAFAGTAVELGVALSYNDLGYYGLGFDGANHLTQWYSFDPSTNAWTAKTAYGGTGRSEACGFVIGAYGYVGYGWSGAASLRTWYRYDFAGNSWAATATDGLTYAGSNSPERKALAIAVNGYGFVWGGGNVTGAPQSTFEDGRKFNPSGAGAWTTLGSGSDLPDGRKHGVLLLYKGKLLLIAGTFHQSGGAPSLPGIYHRTGTERFPTTFVSYIDEGIRIQDGSKIRTVVCEPYNAVVSPLQFAKSSQIHGISLVPIYAITASGVYVQTADGIRAIEVLKD